jgi:Reverse transcriptase (RNA-dependent DNA polymerase)
VSSGVHDNQQFGFRKGSGTDLAVLELNNKILSAIDDNKIAGVIYFDVSKAFDTISHEILYEKLNAYGVRGLPLELIKSYFDERL